MKIVTIIGARPQFIKAAAFSRAITGVHDEILVHTGQHFDANMSDIFFKELNIPEPRYNLGISGGTHGKMTGSMLIAIEEVLINEKPDSVLVYGDTNSTIAGALAAAKLGIPILHIEAGVRLRAMQNPEEINRIITDHIASFLFAPTNIEKDNLIKENLGDKAYIVGNIMYDSYLYCMNQLPNKKVMQIYDLNGNQITIPERYYYLTCHRQENTCYDSTLIEILKAMNQLDAPTLYPVHPRNRKRVFEIYKNNRFDKIILIQPVGYFESIYLLSHCEKVVTDSGGLQCEAFFAKKQCLTIFDWVAWPQTIVDNRNQISNPIASEILEKLNKKQRIEPSYHPFGDGHTAERIIKIIKDKWM